LKLLRDTSLKKQVLEGRICLPEVRKRFRGEICSPD